MGKEKIAISIDSELLSEIDSIVDGVKVRSRSQAIEVLLRESIKSKPVTTAVMLIHRDALDYLFKDFEGLPFIQHNLNFLIRNKFKELYIISCKDARLESLAEENIKGFKIFIVEENHPKGTAVALSLIKDKLSSDFLVLNGDTFNDFDLKRMIMKHKSGRSVCTMGLISSSSPSDFGSVVMDGELIVDFREKKEAISNIINAGIYVFKPNVFLLYDEKTKSLEKDLFPKLAKLNLLQGFFTLGKYIHIPDN
jgi:NDP-sugar pyrophosphorylase family protein